MPSVTTVTAAITAPAPAAVDETRIDTARRPVERAATVAGCRSLRRARSGSPCGRSPIHVVAGDGALVAIDRRSDVADHRHRRRGAVRRSTARCLSGARLRRARDGHRSARHHRRIAKQRESAPLDPADDEPDCARCPSRWPAGTSCCRSGSFGSWIRSSSARRWRTKWRTSPGAIPNGASRSRSSSARCSSSRSIASRAPGSATRLSFSATSGPCSRRSRRWRWPVVFP